MNNVEIKDINSQRSWVIGSDQVELAVTMRGAHMAPVVFNREGGHAFQPYYISPWQGEGLAVPCPVLAPLRGDFFCMPFGGNATAYNGEAHPPHGEVSGSEWSLVGAEKKSKVTTLTIRLDTHVRTGRVTRQFSLMDGQQTVYLTTTVEGFAGLTSFGHHAMLAMPKREGAVLISTSSFRFGMTCPHPFSRPENREYQSFAVGAEIDSLLEIPTIFKERLLTDASSYPARFGYADLLGLFEEPRAVPGKPSWVAAVNTEDHWLWFALKNPQDMPARVIWMENHGRHGNPWNGRNCCIGLEDGCMYFDAGVSESSHENIISRRGIPTCREMKAGEPFCLKYIQGAVRVPDGFGRVVDAEFGPDQVTFVDAGGERISATVCQAFLF
jgi:hypothetical protein